MILEKEIAEWITAKHQSDDSFEGHTIFTLLDEVDVYPNYEEMETENGEVFNDWEVWYYGRHTNRRMVSVDRIKDHLRFMGWTEEHIGTPTIEGLQEIKMPKLLSPKASEGPFSQLA